MSQAGNTTSSSPTPSNSFSPNSRVDLFDDFIGTTGGGSYLLTWKQVTFTPLTTTEDNHPGIISSAEISDPDNTTSAIYLSNTIGSIYSFILGGGVLQINWVFNLTTLSDDTNTYIFTFGMGDTFIEGPTDQENGCYFSYSHNSNSGNWTYICSSNSVMTTTNSSIPVTTGWHNGKIIINAAASSVEFFIDDVSLGAAITTNIPTSSPISPMVQIQETAGTSVLGTFLIDLFYLSQNLTNPR